MEKSLKIAFFGNFWKFSTFVEYSTVVEYSTGPKNYQDQSEYISAFKKYIHVWGFSYIKVLSKKNSGGGGKTRGFTPPLKILKCQIHSISGRQEYL